MHPNFVHDPRQQGSDLGQWMLALVAMVFLWGTLILMGHTLH